MPAGGEQQRDAEQQEDPDRAGGTGDTAPLVVTLPTVWRGEDAASFFTDLEQSWLEVVPVGEVASRQAVGVPASSLLYTEADEEAELDASAFAAS